MDDRTLLERAAKAAGWSCWQSKHGYLNVESPDGEKHVCCRDWVPFDPYSGKNNAAPTLYDALQELDWNPPTDDGDALRLAVKLRIGVKYHNNAPPELCLPRECAVATDGTGKWFAEVAQNGDENAATRRAIVRAAAAMADKGE